jgi:hypothetical protein
MRYEKGTIAVSRERDWPILQTVFRSGYITSEQIFGLTQSPDVSRAAHRKRLTRLVRNGLLSKRIDVDGLRKAVYSSTEACIQMLLIGGEYYSGRTGFENNPQACCHALAVNELHLALRRSGRLARWIPVTEICSRNDLTRERYVKDYDGIAVMKVEDREVPLAIEFERVLKSRQRYEEIRSALEFERYVRILLYVTPHLHVADYLHEKFKSANGMNVCVCLLSEFQEDPWNTRVRIATQNLELALRYALEFLPAPRENDPLSAMAAD